MLERWSFDRSLQRNELKRKMRICDNLGLRKAPIIVSLIVGYEWKVLQLFCGYALSSFMLSFSVLFFFLAVLGEVLSLGPRIRGKMGYVRGLLVGVWKITLEPLAWGAFVLHVGGNGLHVV